MTNDDNEHIKTNETATISPHPGSSVTIDAVRGAEQGAAYLLCDAQAAGAHVVGAVPLQLHSLIQDQAQVAYTAKTSSPSIKQF